MHMPGVSQLLTDKAHAGEWLYIEQNSTGADVLNVTNGYWDKFWLCIWDLFCRFQTAERTRLCIDKLLNNAISYLNQEEPLQNIERANCYSSVISNLSKVKLIWNKTLNNPPEFNPDISLFKDDLSQMEEIFAILPNLPKKKQDKITQIKAKIDTAVQNLNGITNQNSHSEKVKIWLELSQAIIECKKVFTKCSSASAGWGLWNYKVGFWCISPRSQIFNTAAGSKKILPYLDCSFDMGEFVYEQGQQNSPKSDFSDQGNQQIQGQLNNLLKFMKGQAESQRRPVSIFLKITSGATDITLVNFLRNQISSLICQNPDYFLHQTSLFEEVRHENQEGRVNQYHCFSMVRSSREASGLDYEGISCILRPEVTKVLNRLPKQGKAQTPGPYSPLEKLKVEKALMNSEQDYDFTIQLCGKQKGCHKEILLSAFPHLESRENIQGKLKTDNPNLLNLDSHGLEIQIPPGYEDWILQALVTFAYTRAHPNLPTQQTKETQQAYHAYRTLLDYLRPLSVALN